MQASRVYASTGMTFWKQCTDTTPCPPAQMSRMCRTLAQAWGARRQRSAPAEDGPDSLS